MLCSFRGLLLFALVGITIEASAVEYHVVNLGALTPWPNNFSEAFDVNDSGMVVGNVSYGVQHPFVWTPSGGMHAMGPLMRAWHDCVPRSVNNSGQVTGTIPWPFVRHPFLYQRGSGYKALDILRTPGYSEGFAVNESGEVTGTSYFDNGSNLEPQAFFWSPSVGNVAISPLHQGGSTYGLGLSNVGTVVGQASFFDGSNYHSRAFRWTSTSGTENLGVLSGCIGSLAEAVNSSETIVGYCLDPNFNTLAFRWTSLDGMSFLGFLGQPSAVSDNGEIVGSSASKAFSYKTSTGLVYLNDHLDAESHGWNLQIVNGVNNNGWIVGRGDINGKTVAYLAIPQ